jgi:hypothetical protein
VGKWLRRAFTTDMPYWSAMSSLTVIAILPSLGLVAALLLIELTLGVPISNLAPDIAIRSFSDSVPRLVVGVPLMETAILGMGLSILAMFRLSPLLTSAISAFGWALAHAVFSAPFHFFGVIWLFFVCSRGYLTWRSRGLPQALGIACVPHMAQNFLVVYVVLSLD